MGEKIKPRPKDKQLKQNTELNKPEAKKRINQMRREAKRLTREMGLPRREMGEVLFMMYSDMLPAEAFESNEKKPEGNRPKTV